MATSHEMTERTTLPLSGGNYQRPEKGHKMPVPRETGSPAQGNPTGDATCEDSRSEEEGKAFPPRASGSGF